MATIFDTPGLDAGSIFLALQQQQTTKNFIDANKDDINKLKIKYTGTGFSDWRMNNMATPSDGNRAELDIKFFQQMVSFEPYWQQYNKFGSPGNMHEKTDGREFYNYMVAQQKEFKSASAYGQFLGGADDVLENIDNINDYLRAIDEPELAATRELAAAQGASELLRFDKYQRSYGNLSRSGANGFTAEEGQMLLDNVNLYNDWDVAFQSNGLPAPTMDEVRQAAEEFDTAGNMNATFNAKGLAQSSGALSEDSITFFESLGFGEGDIVSAYKGRSGEFFKQIQAFADMNPVYKKRANIPDGESANITDLDTLNSLIKDYQDSTNLSAWYNAEDFASSVGQQELTSLQPFGIDFGQDELAERSFAGEQKSLQSKIVEARERKKSAFTSSATAGGGRQSGGQDTSDFNLSSLFS